MLLGLSVGDLCAQAVSDSLVQVQDSIPPVEIVDEQTDTIAIVEADTLSVQQPRDTVAVDTVRPKSVRPTLPRLMRPYFVLKLTRDNRVSGSLRLDTVSVAYERILGVLDYLNDPATPERYIRKDPGYYRLFIPFTYFERPIARVSRLPWHFSGVDSLKSVEPCLLRVDTMPFVYRKQTEEVVDRALLAAYVNHLDLVRFTEDKIKEGPSYRDDIEKEEESRPSVLKLFKSAVTSDRERSSSAYLESIVLGWIVRCCNLYRCVRCKLCCSEIHHRSGAQPQIPDIAAAIEHTSDERVMQGLR